MAFVRRSSRHSREADTGGDREATIETEFPTIADLFTIDDFGGWSQVKTDIFGDDGVYTQVIAEVKGG